MPKYRVRPIISYGQRKYIVEEQKKMWCWSWWKPIKDFENNSLFASFYFKEHAENFIKDLQDMDK